MAFTIPNLADAAFPDQAKPSSTDIDALLLGVTGTGVFSGCDVTAQGSPDMSVHVASGNAFFGTLTIVPVVADDLAITTAHATLPRYDLVVVDDGAVLSVVNGDPATVALLPAIPASSVPLAGVYVPAADTAIGATQIIDKRVLVQDPNTFGGSAAFVRKAADESVSDENLQDDDHLYFAAEANSTYRVKWTLTLMSADTSSSFKFNLTVPSGAVYNIAGWGIVAGGDGSVDNAGTALAANIVVDTTDADGRGTAIIEGIVTTAGNAGDVKLQWARQSTSASAHYVMANSLLEYQEIA